MDLVRSQPPVRPPPQAYCAGEVFITEANGAYKLIAFDQYASCKVVPLANQTQWKVKPSSDGCFDVHTLKGRVVYEDPETKKQSRVFITTPWMKLSQMRKHNPDSKQYGNNLFLTTNFTYPEPYDTVVTRENARFNATLRGLMSMADERLPTDYSLHTLQAPTTEFVYPLSDEQENNGHISIVVPMRFRSNTQTTSKVVECTYSDTDPYVKQALLTELKTFDQPTEPSLAFACVSIICEYVLKIQREQPVSIETKANNRVTADASTESAIETVVADVIPRQQIIDDMFNIQSPGLTIKSYIKLPAELVCFIPVQEYKAVGQLRGLKSLHNAVEKKGGSWSKYWQEQITKNHHKSTHAAKKRKTPATGAPKDGKTKRRSKKGTPSSTPKVSGVSAFIDDEAIGDDDDDDDDELDESDDE